MCLAVCPGREVPIDALADRFLNADRKSAALGRYRQLLLGHACDHEVRFNSSSGGLITALLTYALEKKLIDGAVVLGHDVNRPLLTRPYVARDREGIVTARGSKYCPSAVNAALREIQSTPGNYAFVGLPCHVHGLRKWMARSPLLRARIRYVFGLFCISNNTYLGTEYFLLREGICPDDVRSIRYRANGWPGEIEVCTERKTYLCPCRSAEKNAGRRAFLSSAFHFDFMVPRCLVCCDQTSELADASFADPHLPEMRAKYYDGVSLGIVRSSAAEELIESARADGCIHVEPFSEELALRAQNYAHKADVAGRMAYWQALGRPVPDYQRSYRSTWRQRRQARRYRWSFRTHNRNVWPLLRIIQTYRRYSNAPPVIFLKRVLRLGKRWIIALTQKKETIK